MRVQLNSNSRTHAIHTRTHACTWCMMVYRRTAFTGARCVRVHGVCGCTVCMCAQCARVHGCAMLCGCTVFLSIHYSYRLAFRSARRGGAPHRDRCRWLSRLLWLRCAVVAIGATPKRPSTVDCRCTTTCSQRSETGTAQHRTRLARRRTPPHETGASRRSVA